MQQRDRALTLLPLTRLRTVTAFALVTVLLTDLADVLPVALDLLILGAFSCVRRAASAEVATEKDITDTSAKTSQFFFNFEDNTVQPFRLHASVIKKRARSKTYASFIKWSGKTGHRQADYP